MPSEILKKIVIQPGEYFPFVVDRTRSRLAIIVIYPDRLRIHFTFEVKADTSIPKNRPAFTLNRIFGNQLLRINRPPSASRQGWTLPGFFEFTAYGRIFVPNQSNAVFLLEGARPNGNDEVVDIPAGSAVKFDVDEFYSTLISPPADPVLPS